ncbi:MAG: ABC transporter permease subunit [Lachnospiraceae bacterium]|nr:ABC transporter permease subunit [Lachnospiraceae bacterium]
MKYEISSKEKRAEVVLWISRVATFLSVFLLFFPQASPTRITSLIGKNVSLFTSAVSYGTLTSEMGRALNRGWLSYFSITILYIGAVLILLGIIAAVVCACTSLGNLRLKKFGMPFGVGGALAAILGLVLVYISYTQVLLTDRPEKVEPSFPGGFFVYAFLILVILITSIITLIMLPKADKNEKFYMEPKFKLFLMFLPFAMLCFVFSYLPLYGWRYAFFDYSAGGTLSADNFVGFKWFTNLFQSEATKADVVRVLRNTLAMSGLGIATSWLPMAFAIFLNEIKVGWFKRIVQTFTTIPNFISWVLVYAIALAIFSTDGFINTAFGGDTNYLMGNHLIWLKMLAWGTWKGIGWSAIIYIAGISGIDQQLYEAATVDGAGRFQKMWHVTVPGLLPTYFVMLLMSVANVLSNGMDQYLVFKNAQNVSTIEVLDLYVYTLGIQNGNIPLSTVIGMVKSVVSVVLLFGANGISKAIRGESIV